MSAMNTILAVAKAIEILEPLVVQTVEYLQGGDKPAFMTTLPDTLKSRIALNLTKAGKQ